MLLLGGIYELKWQSFVQLAGTNKAGLTSFLDIAAAWTLPDDLKIYEHLL